MILPLLLLLLSPALADISTAWPFNSQYPLVARVDSEYLFTVASNTFSSQSALQYSLSDSPSWLSIDPSTGHLSGTPDSLSIISFTLSASDSAGNVIHSNNTLTISDRPAPQLASSHCILDQLASYGQTNRVDGLVLVPGHDFSISFDKSRTFIQNPRNGNPLIAYYGLSANRTSLPPWVSFSLTGSNMTFSGTAPAVNSKIAPSVVYPFDLIATDYEGFLAVIATFKLVIGAHQLSTSVQSPISISTNSSFDIEVPLDKVFLDGNTINSQNISSINLTDNVPDWIKLNQEKALIYGTLPENHHNLSTSFSVDIYDQFQDVVSLPFKISSPDATNSTFSNSSNTSSNSSSASSNFTSPSTPFNTDNIPSVVNATRGHFFQYALLPSMFVSDTPNVTASFSSSWLHFDTQNNTFFGNVPAQQFSDIVVVLSAATTKLSKRQEQSQVSFTIRGVKAHHGFSKNQKLAIILGTILPVVAIIIALLIACCLYKRREQKSDLESSTSHNISKPLLNNPYNMGQRSVTRQDSFATAEEELEKTISNNSSNDGSNYKHPFELEKQTELSSESQNWQIIRDNSSLSYDKQNKGEIESIHSSVTDVEFNEQFNDEDPKEESQNYNTSGTANDTSNTANDTSNSKYMDTVEYPTNYSPYDTAPREYISTDNLLDMPTSLSSSNLSKHNRLTAGTVEPTEDEKEDTSEFKTANNSDNMSAKETSNRNSNLRVPRKSWRQVVNSTRLRLSGNRRQESINSLATVSTDELFSVRLVDDRVGKTIDPSELPAAEPTAKVDREDSGNVTRLDSKGNVVHSSQVSATSSDYANQYYDQRSSSISNSSSSSSQRKSRLSFSAPDLEVLKEEHIPVPRISEESNSKLDNSQEQNTKNDLELDHSAEIGRNNITNQSDNSFYNNTFGTTGQRTMMSYSEQSRAQKANHSRKRNLSQTCSSSSDSYRQQRSFHSSSNSKSSSKSPSPFKSHQKEDSFSFDAGNPLPVIYSPNLNFGSSENITNFDDAANNADTVGALSVPTRRNPYNVRRNLKRNLSEDTSTTEEENINGHEHSSTIDTTIPRFSPNSDDTSSINENDYSGFTDMDLGNPILLAVNNRRSTRGHIIEGTHHKRSHSSMGSRSNESSEVVYDYTD